MMCDVVIAIYRFHSISSGATSFFLQKMQGFSQFIASLVNASLSGNPVAKISSKD